MKRLLLLAAFLFITSHAYSATNTFPASGDAGIGTTSPNVPLEVTTNVTALPAPSFSSQVQVGTADGNSTALAMDAFQDSNSGVSNGILGRLYGGANASPTAASGTMLLLCGQAYNGTGLPTTNDACIFEATDGTQTTSSAPSKITFSTTPSGSTTRATVMEINNAGYVGIGTTSPAGTFDVEGGTAAASTNGTPVNVVAQNAGSGNQNGGNIILIPGAATGTGSPGRVGIGTTSPGVSLDVGSKTDALALPSGTSAQRPTGVAGMLRYNSTNSVPEFYAGSWLPVPLTASSPIVISSTTGNITCPTCNTSSANVNSVSGDGTLITNSLSTGAVTLTLGNAAAYSIWGNNTGSSAAPSYTTSPKLSGTITDLQSIGATSTDGMVLLNGTAAALNSQQYSPRLRWTGQGWETGTGASQEADAIAELQPVQGAANPSFNWVLSGQINNGGYTPLLTVPSGGGLNLNSGVYEINGTQIAASNLLNGVTGSGNIVLATSPTLTTPNIGAATGTSLAVTGNITTSAGEIGIGTASPLNELDVSGGTAIGTSYAGTDTAPTSGLIVQGNVGIGTATPSNPLSVNGIVQSLTGGFKFPDGTTQTTAASGSSGMVLLATVNASSASSVVFGSSYITSTYNKYVIEYDSAYDSDGPSGNATLCMQLSTNNGSSWITSGYTGTGCPPSGTTAVAITPQNIAISSTPTQGTVTFSVPSASQPLVWMYNSNIAGSSTLTQGAGSNSGTTAVNAIQILPCSNGGCPHATITGNFHLYGLQGT